MSESEAKTGETEAEEKALEEIGIPRGIQEGIKGLVAGSRKEMDGRYVDARAAGDAVEREGPSYKNCLGLIGALYLHGEAVELRRNFTTSSTGLPALDQALKREIEGDRREVETLKGEVAAPLNSCLAKSSLPQR